MCVFEKKLIFWWIFSKCAKKLQKMQLSQELWIWIVFQVGKIKEALRKVVCSASSRRKPGWRFTAGSTYGCSWQLVRAQKIRLIYNFECFFFRGNAFVHVEPAVNRQPGFRRELVEQSSHLISSFMISFSKSYSTAKLLNSAFYIEIFRISEKI